ncbi:MAG: PKD domain-containing protein [bacterium]|nr:PKD domain-containing protein [bacterium]
MGVYRITVTNPDAQFSTLPSAITVYESVTAEFSGNPTSGTAPLTVNFTNLSTGNYDTCSWVFGDGITKKECGNPSHTYNTPGIYTVSLTMSGFGSSDVEVKEEYISISENYMVYCLLSYMTTKSPQDALPLTE